MFIHYRTRGLIFKKEDRGETNELLTIYTKDFGKLKILGKAIKKIKSKLRSGAELFYLSEIEFIQGKTHKTLTDAVSIEKFSDLRKDLKRLSLVYKISEILDNLIKGQEADEKIWQLLTETFGILNNWKIENWRLKIIYYYFLWNFLSILGYRPELYNCLSCQKRLIPEKLCFDLKGGGIICQSCIGKLKLSNGEKSGIIEINSETVKILRVILEKKWLTVSKLKIETKYLKELSLVSKNYLSRICPVRNLSNL